MKWAYIGVVALVVAGCTIAASCASEMGKIAVAVVAVMGICAVCVMAAALTCDASRMDSPNADSEPTEPEAVEADDIPDDALFGELTPEQVEHLARGLEQAYGCTIRNFGWLRVLGLVECEGGVVIAASRTVRDLWRGAEAMRNAADEADNHHIQTGGL